jgi:hypothetical protein
MPIKELPLHRPGGGQKQFKLGYLPYNFSKSWSTMP